VSEIDWSALQQEAKTAGVIPAGDYPAVIISAEAKTSSTGKPMVSFKARVTDGPQVNKPIWSQFVVSPESAMALRMYFLQMAAFGLDSEFFAQNPTMADVARNLVNRAAIFKLSIRQWQGADRNQVDGVSAIPAGAPLPPGVATGPGTVSAGGPTSMAPMNALTPAGPPVPTATTPTTTPTTPAAPNVQDEAPASRPTTPF
jgi:hypothetical protein